MESEERMKKILIILSLTFLIPMPCSIGQSVESFFIGAIRSDGVLVPFALYDSGKWSSPWPGYFDPGSPRSSFKNLNDSTITTLLKIPPAWAGSQKKIPSSWWKPGTEGDSLFTVSKPVIIPSYCVKLWALLLSNRKPPQDTHAYVPMTGMAASKKLPFSPLITISPSTPEWKELSRFIQSLAQKKEAEAGSPLSGKGKAAIKMNISIIRNKLPFHEAYYFYYAVEKLSYSWESDKKRYRCKTLSGEGWIRKDRTGALAAFEKDNFGASESYIPDIESYIFRNNDIPFGMLVLQDKMYWIIDDPGYESESCVIYRIDRVGIAKVIGFYLGGC